MFCKICNKKCIGEHCVVCSNKFRNEIMHDKCIKELEDILRKIKNEKKVCHYLEENLQMLNIKNFCKKYNIDFEEFFMHCDVHDYFSEKLHELYKIADNLVAKLKKYRI